MITAILRIFKSRKFVGPTLVSEMELEARSIKVTWDF